MYRIPPQLDFDMILRDLRACGWVDQKLEVCLGLSAGYVSHLRSGNVGRISLEFASRLHNLWADEMERSERIQIPAATTG